MEERARSLEATRKFVEMRRLEWNEAVDARNKMIYFARKEGMPVTVIARLLGLAPGSVTVILRNLRGVEAEEAQA
ncbi:hypothetical protein BST28_17480 [Mycolicibacter kumamotonensis]|uniref:Sigma-70 family RNA polymerase sigma factor n=2 Tax=Mycolicibacter kumamotonensis TaxID=354243 RepID=A0A1X0DYP6_9MYCO|nr:hypothetical protein BST28_17480 [Mycolicibacter kumamotonensis]